MLRPVRHRVQPQCGLGQYCIRTGRAGVGVGGRRQALFDARPQDERAGANADRLVGIFLLDPVQPLDGLDPLGSLVLGPFVVDLGIDCSGSCRSGRQIVGLWIAVGRILPAALGVVGRVGWPPRRRRALVGLRGLFGGGAIRRFSLLRPGARHRRRISERIVGLRVFFLIENARKLPGFLALALLALGQRALAYRIIWFGLGRVLRLRIGLSLSRLLRRLAFDNVVFRAPAFRQQRFVELVVDFRFAQFAAHAVERLGKRHVGPAQAEHARRQKQRAQSREATPCRKE